MGSMASDVVNDENNTKDQVQRDRNANLAKSTLVSSHYATRASTKRSALGDLSNLQPLKAFFLI
jgi:hypothetical protein